MTDVATAEEMYETEATVEELVGDARGLFSAMHDEDVPEITDSFTRESAQKRTGQGIEILDKASNALFGFGAKYEDLQFRHDELLGDVEDLHRLVGSVSFTLLASELARELDGRLLTDSPESVLTWVRAALRRVEQDGEPDDAGDASETIYDAMKAMGAA